MNDTTISGLVVVSDLPFGTTFSGSSAHLLTPILTTSSGTPGLVHDFLICLSMRMLTLSRAEQLLKRAKQKRASSQQEVPEKQEHGEQLQGKAIACLLESQNQV